MGISRVDKIYRSVILKKFFTKGWGSPETLKTLFEFRKVMSNRTDCLALVDTKHPIQIDEIINSIKGAKVINGHFTSPLVKHLPGLLPPASETSYFQLIVPTEWKAEEKPICIHMAGTGDHYFWRRRSFLAKPLLFNDNIGSLLIENPFYGLRKPPEQIRSSLRNVADIFLMGGALMLESIALIRWLENEGYGPITLHGISMGGHMASLAATNWPKPIGVAPCLSWSTASSVFTQGVMSKAVDWSCLEQQFVSDQRFHREIIPMICSNSEAYLNGKKFGVNYPTLAETKLALLKVLANTNEFILPERLPPVLSERLVTSVNGVLKKTQERWIQSKMDISDKRLRNRLETLTFMHAIMDECTHLKNFAVPVAPDLVSIVAARDDAYVLREDVTSMEDVWPGCKINFTNCGHISAFILYHIHFRHAIIESLNMLRAKYNLDGTPRNPTLSSGPPQS